MKFFIKKSTNRFLAVQKSNFLHIKVIPNAKRAEVIAIDNQHLRVKVDAPPEDGKANKRLIEILAEQFDVPKNAISIIQGAKSREKIVEIIRT